MVSGPPAALGRLRTGMRGSTNPARRSFDAETQLDGAGVNFSPDGKWLVVRESDEVNFVRVSDWEKQFTLRRDQPGFANVAISPDMKLLAISEMTHVKLYDFSSRKLLALLRGPNDVRLSSSHPSAAAICFSQTANYLPLVPTKTSFKCGICAY